MATVSFVGDLSGQTNGRAIKVTPTATAGETLHTFSGAGEDIITIWAMNTSTSAVKLTLEWGGATAPDDLVEITIPPEDGPIKVVDRRVLSVSSGTVAAFAGTADVITCWGEVWNAV